MDLKMPFQGKLLCKFKTIFSVISTTNKDEPRNMTTNSQQNLHVKQHQNGNVRSLNKTDKSKRHKHKKNLHVSKEIRTVEETCKRNETECRTTVIQPGINAETTTGSSTTQASRDMVVLFPRNTHWLVFLFTLVFRVWYVSRKENWWILHPDEIYQTLEVAHSEVYGYGFRTYEYLPEKITGYHVSAARAQGIQRGMFSLRSFILPHLISIIMYLVDRIGLHAYPYLVGRVTHAVITSCLPLSVHYFTRSMFKSRDTAALAAILVSTSQTLNMLGTHSFINSFLSPFVFLCLTPLVKSLLICKEQDPETSKPESPILSRDHNSNVTVNNNNHVFNGTGVLERLKKPLEQNVKSKIYGHVQAGTSRRCLFKFGIMTYISGLVLSFCVYSRCDIILIPIFITLAFAKLSYRMLLSFVLTCNTYLCGFATGILVAGFYDRVCYRVWFISPYQWIKFNVIHGTSQVLFGKQSVVYYIENVLFTDSLNTLLSVIILLDLLVFYLLSRELDKEKSAWKHADYVPFCIFMLLLLTYSSASHKEMRFFHNGIVFMLIHISSAILRLFKTIVNCTNQKHGQYYCWFYLFIGVLASSQMFSFIQIQGDVISRWSYMGNNVSQDFNQCLHYVSLQNDVTGVFLDQPIYMTGGYTILHKDVPIYVLNMYEFFEFSRSSRLKLSNVYNQNIMPSSFAYMSDFVSVHNIPYLLKQLLSKPEYNYFVLDVDRQFIETGYNEVFRKGSAKVMKRQTTDESEAVLLKMASNIPLGQNATILEYEGYWLLHHGLYEIAQDKLMFANRLDTSRIGPYQLLIRLFHYFKQEDLVRNVLDSCLVKHDRSKCVSEYQAIKLHNGYFIDIN